MASFSQRSFSAGQLSPRMGARGDFEKYDSGLETCTNSVLLPQGPIKSRNGSEWISEVKDSTKGVRLIPFQIDSGSSAMLEFGDTYVRFYENGAQVLETSVVITGITKANPGVVTTSTAHGYSNGDHVYITGVVGMTEVNDSLVPYVVANKASTTFELTTLAGANVNTTSFTTYGSVGVVNKIHELVTPYLEGNLTDITYAQFGSGLFLAHGAFETRTLTRTSSASWAISPLSLSPPPTEELGFTPTGITMTLAATSGTAVVVTVTGAVFIDGDIGRQILNDLGKGVATITVFTSSTQVTVSITETFDSTGIAAGDWTMDLSTKGEIGFTVIGDGNGLSGEEITIDSTAASPDLFRSVDVGQYIRVHGGTAQITSQPSATQIKAVIKKSFDAITDTFIWTIEDLAWSSTRGYPRAVSIAQERLILAGTTVQPQTLWMSEQSIFTGFGIGADDEDAITVTIGSAQANQITWVSNSRDIVVGTTGSEITIESSTNGPITSGTITQRDRTGFGSRFQVAVKQGTEVLFYTQKKIRSFRYDFNIDGYVAEDLLFLAENLGDSTIDEIAGAIEPDSQLYAITGSGVLLAGTFIRDQRILGWGRFTTDGLYERVQTMKTTNDHEVWVVVNRTINSVTKRYIERFDNGDGTDALDGFSDCYIKLDTPLAMTAATAADPIVITSASHGLVNGDTVIIRDVVGMTELNGNVYTVANKATNTFELNNSSGATIDGSAFTTYVSGGNAYKRVTALTGLDHLEGKVVEIKADGALQPSQTVTSGAITLDSAAGQVTIGLAYTQTVKTLKREFQLKEGGTGQGQRSRYIRPILRVTASIRPLVNGEAIPGRSGEDTMDSEVPLVTGDLVYSNMGWDAKGQLTITKTGPFPLELLGIFSTSETGAI